VIDYDKFWEDHSLVDEGPSAKHRRRIIMKLVRKYALQGDVLDVGCGCGSLLKDLLNERRGYKLMGIDISEKAIKQAENQILPAHIMLEGIDFPYKPEDLRVMEGDITKKHTLPEEEFDLVICSEVLEHIEDDLSAIENLWKLVKEGGYLIITVPHRMFKWTKQDENAGHVRRYEWFELIGKLRDAKFNVLEIFSWGFPFYSMYHDLLLANVNPKTTRTNPTVFKKTISKVLYYLFFMNDLFKTRYGEMLFVVAKNK